MRRILILIFLIFFSFTIINSEDKKLTILFTHDLHSYLLPHKDIDRSNDITQLGGYAKIATIIQQQKKLNPDKTITLDAGDLTMGTLFHTLMQTEASELRLMGMMGYDVVTLGNHDFDFHTDGLANMLKTAKSKNEKLPEIVFSNALFSKNNEGDAFLKEEFKNYPVKEYTIIEKNGLKIGIFGIMGKDAASDAPFSFPVNFADPIKASKNIVSILKNKEKVDMIICLSHSGTSKIKTNSEDEILAKKVPEIDVIISGHTHTILDKPMIIGNTSIVSSGSYGSNLGILEINFLKEKHLSIASYNIKPITNNISDDKSVMAHIDEFKKLINNKYLSKYKYNYDEAIAEIDFNMESLKYAYENPGETGIGDLITDAYRYAVEKAEGNNYEYVNMAIQPLGNIRSTFFKGKITVSDVFLVASLGLGTDSLAGYPLTTCYVTGADIKKILEIDSSIALFKDDAHLQVSGVKFSYNPKRFIFNRVTKILISDKDGTYKPVDYKKLYRICMNYYTALMVNYIGKASFGILDIKPRDKSGNIVKDLKQLIIRNNDNSEKIKEWVAIADYLKSFPNTNKNELPKVSEKYSKPDGRININK